MTFLDRIKALFSSAASSAKPAAPTKAEMQAALNRLDALAKPAILGEIGGAKPPKRDRAASWWGGNFLGAPDEDIPACARSGRPMHPVLQIRVDELPEIPAAFQEITLINIWMDLESSTFWGAENGNGFCVRTYADIDALTPLGVGYRESGALPTFPIFWRETLLEQPSWEDMVEDLPPNVARASGADWFFNSKYSTEFYDELRSAHPIKLGGWPTWIQGSDWPANAQFLLQVDSTEKGRMFLGDSGSFYIFKTPESWAIRGDCY